MDDELLLAIDELKRYLNAIVILLALNIGFMATLLLVSAESLSASFLVVPPAIGAFIALVVVSLLTNLMERTDA
jgi:membrane-associated HD superfamily phosphohydrolase